MFGIFFDQGIWRYLFIAAAVVMAEKIGFTKLDVQKSAFSIGECTSTVVRSCGRPTHSKVDSLSAKLVYYSFTTVNLTYIVSGPWGLYETLKNDNVPNRRPLRAFRNSWVKVKRGKTFLRYTTPSSLW